MSSKCIYSIQSEGTAEKSKSEAINAEIDLAVVTEMKNCYITEVTDNDLLCPGSWGGLDDIKISTVKKRFVDFFACISS